jgi:hypothetical protein
MIICVQNLIANVFSVDPPFYVSVFEVTQSSLCDAISRLVCAFILKRAVVGTHFVRKRTSHFIVQ